MRYYYNYRKDVLGRPENTRHPEHSEGSPESREIPRYAREIPRYARDDVGLWKYPKETGISLIELLICLTILSFAFYFINPISSATYHKNQMLVIADDIKAAIRVATLQAMISGEPLMLVARDEAIGWASGLALYSNAFQKNKSLIHTWPWLVHDLQISWQGFESKSYLRFTSALAHNAVNGTFVIQTNQQPIMTLKVNRLGRVRVVEGGISA